MTAKDEVDHPSDMPGSGVDADRTVRPMWTAIPWPASDGVTATEAPQATRSRRHAGQRAGSAHRGAANRRESQG